jgi:succinyl-CoA synthetase beta subunit
LTEREGLALLDALGIPHVDTVPADSEDVVCAAAEEVGYPVVLKTAQPGILHKSDVGGVVTGLTSRSALVDAYGAMRERLGATVLIQRQVDLAESVELLLGMTLDEQFGPLVTVGLGGIWVETVSDAVTFLAPCSAAEVACRLPGLRGYAMLTGSRGRLPVDIAALADLVEQFSIGAATLAPRVAEIDINPLIAAGSSFLALDVLIVPASADALDDAASKG